MEAEKIFKQTQMSHISFDIRAKVVSTRRQRLAKAEWVDSNYYGIKCLQAQRVTGFMHFYQPCNRLSIFRASRVKTSATWHFEKFPYLSDNIARRGTCEDTFST